MKYVYEISFKDKPECDRCMLQGVKGQDLKGESVLACFAIGNRPKCPEEGCHRDCPLKQVSE